ncbi:hypothetical protein [Pandoraea sp. XY-2]|uniref:hypothetical protein n=1 Tax=Pandoraea sp. XY-2 TaxID=2518599 RepID=UPI00101AEF77|nr:hypothetical protein [Pandoraea sp. XY-2]QBC31840.1 hypothetical protein DRB87_11365 [Pandoraea sp. XY-2]
MNTGQRQVSTADQLLSAAADVGVRHITVMAELSGVPTLRLSPGQTLSGADPQSAVRFAAGQDGLQLRADNHVENLRLVTDPDRRAIFNDTTVEQLGRLVLCNLGVTGVVQLLARDQVRGGHVEVRDVDIVAADARGYDERPKGYGVEVIPGAFTLWNQQADPAVTITADLTGLSAGRAGAPVRGSGIFVSGAGDVGGRLVARRLETGAVYSDGGIVPGTPDRITGGVFTVYGAFVDSVRNHGPVTTYGPNDMVLDNWGTVDHWVAEDKITSYGPSGIGFVNFGTVSLLQVNAPIETFGQGARGFNVYTGTVQSAEFERVVTHADGAVGIQISQPVGRITVRRGIETYGGTGDSLVKGVVVRLSAIALSVKPGGSAREVEIEGGAITHGQGVNPLELHGTVDSLRVSGGFVAAGGGFDKI